MPQMKYEKHNARQYEQILRAARQLFVEKGIERVSFSAVADSCGIARATLYKYFPDKESLLWAIHRQALRTFGNALLARAEARPLTALERFSVYFEELARRFELDPDFLLFSTCLKKPIRRKRRGVAALFTSGCSGREISAPATLHDFYARILTMAPCGPDWTRNSPPSAPRIQRCMYSSAWEKTARLCR